MEAPQFQTTVNDGLLFSAIEMLHCGAEILNERVSFIAIFEEHTERKIGVTCLFAGVEQLLKYRLQVTHWSLVFADINKATPQAYLTGDFVSVNFPELLLRLRSIAQVHLSKEDEAAFEALRRLRNRGMHYNDYVSKDVLIPLYTRVLSSAIDFISTHFEPKSIRRTEQNRIESLRRHLAQYKEFARHRTEKLNEKTNEKGFHYELIFCPLCRQESLLLGPELECGFCGVKYSAQDAVEDYQITHSVWGLSLIRENPDKCAKCGKEHLFEQEKRWLCFTCKMTWDKSRYAMCENCFHIVDCDDMDEDKALCTRCMGR